MMEQCKWYHVEINDIASTFSQNVDYVYESDNDGHLTINSTMTSPGCGDERGPSYIITVLKNNIHHGDVSTKWSKIRYTQQFFGGSSCYSIFGDSKCCGAESLPSYGLIPFDASTDVVIERDLQYGCWKGQPYFCGYDCTNFWNGNHYGYVGYKGLLRVEMRRNLTTACAGIGTGNSCTAPRKTYHIIKDIQLGYCTVSKSTTQYPTLWNSTAVVETQHHTNASCSTIYDTTIASNDLTRPESEYPQTNSSENKVMLNVLLFGFIAVLIVCILICLGLYWRYKIKPKNEKTQQHANETDMGEHANKIKNKDVTDTELVRIIVLHSETDKFEFHIANDLNKFNEMEYRNLISAIQSYFNFPDNYTLSLYEKINATTVNVDDPEDIIDAFEANDDKHFILHLYVDCALVPEGQEHTYI